MKIKRFLSLALAVLLVLSCVPMKARAEEEIPVQGFSFDCHNKTGYVGERDGSIGMMGYSFEPYGASESVTMFSSDPTVATVEYDETYDLWEISYHRLGTTIITATTDSGLTDTCTVTVKEMEQVYIDQPFTVTVHPKDVVLFKWNAETLKYYTFYSENGEGYLNANWRGNLYFGPGADTQELFGDEVLAVWNYSNEIQTYTIWGKESVPPEKFIVTPSQESAYPGDNIDLYVTTYPVWSIPAHEYLPEEDFIWTEGPEDNANPESPVVMWAHPVRIYSSSNENVAYFEDPSNDKITLASPGTTTITVTTKSGILTGQCTITVLDNTTTPEAEEITRLAGATRFETAFEIANQFKENLGVEKFDSVIVASGTNFADALSGSYLAAVKNAPILLTCNKDFNSRLVEKYNAMLVEYISANMIPGGTVYILGGEKAVDPSLDAALTGYRVVRLAGATRYETNLEILKEAGVGNREVLICYGEKFPDSLAASATGNPILLVRNKLTDAQKTFLNTTSGQLVIIGGTAVISNDLENSLKNYGSTERLAGSNRYTTCIMVAERFFDNPSTAIVAYGENFPDGLCGGILAYSMNAPLILVREDYLKASTDYTVKNAISSGIVLGGEGLISAAAVAKIFGN